MHKCTHTHTVHTSNSSTTELLGDCCHCDDPCLRGSWEMAWNGLERERERGSFWSLQTFISHLIIFHICFLIFFYQMYDSNEINANNTEHIIYSELFSVLSLLVSSRYICLVCFFYLKYIFSSIHQSIHLSPCSSSCSHCFPMEHHSQRARGLGQKVQPGLPGLQLPSLGRISWTWGWSDTAFICVQV